MKRLNVLFLFSLCFFIFSCQQEKDFSLNEPNPAYQLSNAASTDSDQTESLEDDFERHLQWVSFITGRVLRYNEEARIEVNNLLSSNPVGDRSIDLNILLDERDPSLLEFNTHFRDALALYLFIIEDNGRPGLALDIPPFAPDVPVEDSIILESIIGIDDFMDYVLEENCVEVYFPKDMVYVGLFEISTTAHPLRNDLSNIGYLRHYKPINGPFNPVLIEEVTIDLSYVDLNDNIIVARPVRTSLGSSSCAYQEYDDIVDFTLFLDY